MRLVSAERTEWSVVPALNNNMQASKNKEYKQTWKIQFRAVCAQIVQLQLCLATITRPRESI